MSIFFDHYHHQKKRLKFEIQKSIQHNNEWRMIKFEMKAIESLYDVRY